MDLVIDANILFASLIKDSGTAGLLFVDRLHLFAPEFLFEEFSKYEDQILKKTRRSKRDFKKFLKVLRRRIKVVPKEDFERYLEKAELASPDPKDVPYIALALYLNASIWSNDKALKKQNLVRIYDTKEIFEMLEN
jgi:predicted nucleic acid-binding protein